MITCYGTISKRELTYTKNLCTTLQESSYVEDRVGGAQSSVKIFYW